MLNIHQIKYPQHEFIFEIFLNFLPNQVCSHSISKELKYSINEFGCVDLQFCFFLTIKPQIQARCAGKSRASNFFVTS